MSIPVKYRLLSIEFRNGKPENQRRLGFREATMTHNAARRQVVIDNVGRIEPHVQRNIHDFLPHELWSIRYEIQAEGSPPIPFCHPFPRGTGVHLCEFINPTARQKNQLFLERDESRKFFSDNFTLEGVSGGLIQSAQPAFQFHE